MNLWHFPYYALVMFWPALFAMLVLAIVAWKRKPGWAQNWRRHSIVVIATAVVVQLLLFLLDPFGAHGTPLVRDVVAVAVFSAAMPGVFAALVASGSEWGVPLRQRILLGSCLGFLIAVVAPFAVLLVHCTSGDCL